MPLTGQELHFANQIDGLLERVERIEKALGGRWEIYDRASPPHVHDFHGPIAPSRWFVGALADAACQCGAEIIDPKRMPEHQR